MAFRSDLESLIMAVLATEPKHGYAIVKSIRETSEDVLKLGEAQLYPVLHRLEEEGTIAGSWEDAQGKPSRKVYALTKSGMKKLEAKREEWRRFTGAVHKLMEGLA